MPLFELASWEVPPDCDVALVAPADLVVQGAWRDSELWVRVIHTARGRFAYVREAANHEIGNWLLSDYTARPQFDLRDYLSQQPNPDFERHINLDGARYGHPGGHALRVGPQSGHWACMGHFAHATFPLPAWSGQGFWATSATQVEGLVRSWLDDADSPARTAFEWLHLDAAQRQSLIFGVSQDGIKAIQLLMRHILHSNEALWNGLSAGGQAPVKDYIWEIPYSESHGGGWDFHQGGSYGGTIGMFMPARLARWRDLIFRYLVPPVVPPESQLAYMKHALEGRIEVRVREPNAHEQLEAHVALREWLDSVGESAQFADLMESEPARHDWNSML